MTRLAIVRTVHPGPNGTRIGVIWTPEHQPGQLVANGAAHYLRPGDLIRIN